MPGAAAEAGGGLPEVVMAAPLPKVDVTVGAGRGSAGAIVLVVSCGSRLQPRASTRAAQKVFTPPELFKTRSGLARGRQFS
ncbi:MAG TPA: hypothetical protein VNI54_11690 [Thermoanaerobaculia bacterium]|nr:hypothetical protein [Thermoanaerobaculia bacterium]